MDKPNAKTKIKKLWNEGADTRNLAKSLEGYDYFICPPAGPRKTYTNYLADESVVKNKEGGNE